MKTIIKNIKVLFIAGMIQSSFFLSAQQNISIDKVDAIINLSSFIDWNTAYQKPNFKRQLFILSDNNSSINYEIQSKNNFKYKNWQIICSNRYEEINNGSIVFVLNEEKSDINELIKISKAKQILTVADNIDSFCENGGMINIKEQNGRYQFEINYQEIQNQNIDVSSKLLALAKIY